MKSSCQNSALNVRQPFLVGVEGERWMELEMGLRQIVKFLLNFHMRKKKRRPPDS